MIHKEKPDAIDNLVYETEVKLSRPFRNKQDAIAYKVTAPNGHTEIFRHAVSKNSQHMLMWENCRCKIEQFTEKRELKGCNIEGIALRQIDENVLVFKSKGKATATINFKKLCKALENMDYHVIGHVCHPYSPIDEIPNCLKGTILDEKYDTHKEE